MNDKPRGIVPVIVSVDGRPYYLLRDMIIEATIFSPYLALRSAFVELKRTGDAQVPYFILHLKGIGENHYCSSGATAFFARRDDEYPEDYEGVKRGDVIIGCQRFTGKNAQALRRWIRGVKI